MNIASLIVVYVIVWWVVFFMALPWGVRRAEGGDLGNDPGAPANPRLLLKAVVTTVIAAALTAAVWWVVVSDIVDLQ